MNKHKNTLGQQGLALALVVQVLVVLAGCGCLHKIILVGNDTPQTILDRVTKARQALEMQLKCKSKTTNSFWVFVYVANYELNLRLVNTKLESRREMGSSKCF